MKAFKFQYFNYFNKKEKKNWNTSKSADCLITSNYWYKIMMVNIGTQIVKIYDPVLLFANGPEDWGSISGQVIP